MNKDMEDGLENYAALMEYLVEQINQQKNLEQSIADIFDKLVDTKIGPLIKDSIATFSRQLQSGRDIMLTHTITPDDYLIGTVQKAFRRRIITGYRFSESKCPYCGDARIKVGSSGTGYKVGPEKIRSVKCTKCGRTWPCADLIFT